MLLGTATGGSHTDQPRSGQSHDARHVGTGSRAADFRLGTRHASGPARRPSQRKISVAIGLLALFLSLVFGVLGFISESEMVLFGRRVHFDIYGLPHLAAE